jgi:hypothetical protein
MKLVKLVGMVSVSGLVLVAGCGKPKAAKTPDKVVTQIAKAVQNNQPEVIFQALPASYQKDINSVVSEAAKKMDAELWNAGHDLMKNVVKVAGKQKKLLLQSKILANNSKKDEISKDWDNAIKSISTLLDSDFTNIKKLRNADMAKMLATSGAAIMKQATAVKSNSEVSEALAKLKSIKATIVSQDGDSAKVKIEAEGEEAKEFDFVKIEDKWIPKEIADSFAAKVKAARENIAKIDFNSPDGKKIKEMVIKQIKVADDMLKTAEKAKTKEELDGILMGMMMQIMMSSQGAAGTTAPPVPAP